MNEDDIKFEVGQVWAGPRGKTRTVLAVTDELVAGRVRWADGATTMFGNEPDQMRQILRENGYALKPAKKLPQGWTSEDEVGASGLRRGEARTRGGDRIALYDDGSYTIQTSGLPLTSTELEQVLEYLRDAQAK